MAALGPHTHRINETNELLEVYADFYTDFLTSNERPPTDREDLQLQDQSVKYWRKS